MALELITPSLDRLDAYVDALQRGWAPDHLRANASRDELDKIARDAGAFVASFVNREGTGTIAMPDGTMRPRLPGYRLWIWDGEFCGSIGLRWQPGTAALPSYVLGHIGYSLVEWKRGRGYAKEALRLMLAHARDEGLPYVELTTDPDNVPSQRVIEANGGTLIERFVRAPEYGATPALRYRIDLDVHSA